MLAVRFVKLLR